MDTGGTGISNLNGVLYIEVQLHYFGHSRVQEIYALENAVFYIAVYGPYKL